MVKQLKPEHAVRCGEQNGARRDGRIIRRGRRFPGHDDAIVQTADTSEQGGLRRARRARRRSDGSLGTRWRLASLVAVSLLMASHPAEAQSVQPAQAKAPPAATGHPPLAPCSSTGIAEPATITLGKSTLIRMPAPVTRMVVGGVGPGYAGKPTEVERHDIKGAGQQQMPRTGTHKTGVADVDVMLLSPTELYLLGKRVGSMNVIVQDRTDKCTVMDVIVTVDAGSLQAKLAQLMPDEKNLKVAAADDSLILSGDVSDGAKLERAMALAAAYAPEKQLVNLMRTRAASQVMLEVKVAEVSKTLLDQLGARVSSVSNGGGDRWTYSVLSEFLSSGAGFLEALKVGKTAIALNGERDDGVVRILAEPNIMAISGQQASFLSGGKIFIPVAQSNASGLGATITLEEKEFGVGVKFIPTVLDGDRINLKVASEVSELSQTGSPFTTVGGITAVLPSFTTRRADTTVQLRDGQSFAIAGLIKSDMTASMKRFPGLGEIPVLGALFRSAEFQRDMTELLFIITPRLVKPLGPAHPLPTDNLVEPTRGEFLFGGQLEGSAKASGTQKPAAASDADSTPVAVKALPAPAEAPLTQPPKEPPAKVEPQPALKPDDKGPGSIRTEGTKPEALPEAKPDSELERQEPPNKLETQKDARAADPVALRTPDFAYEDAVALPVAETRIVPLAMDEAPGTTPATAGAADSAPGEDAIAADAGEARDTEAMPADEPDDALQARVIEADMEAK